MESITRSACQQLDRWDHYRRQSKKAQTALIASFAVAVTAYSVTSLLLASASGGGTTATQFMAQLSSLAGLVYIGVILLGNLKLTKLMVDVMLPTTTMKVLALAQVVIAAVLFLCYGWMSTNAASSRVTALLMMALVGVMVASFVLRMTMHSTPQKRDNYALVSMISTAAQDTLDAVRSSPALQRNPRLISHMVQQASDKLGCSNTKLCPLRRR